MEILSKSDILVNKQKTDTSQRMKYAYFIHKFRIISDKITFKHVLVRYS